jgi:alpha-ketoglutarate-dependent 2,4-dichlorophenoxyacetate dioxygenase
MALSFRPLHPLFAAEAGAIDLRRVYDAATLAEIRAGMDRFGVLVFRNQPFTDDEQLAFAERFDGPLHTQTGQSVLAQNRLGTEALSDISNVGRDGAILPPEDRRRMGSLANRLWHTDASFVDPPGRYSLLSARVLPAVSPDTQFACMRAAYDALDNATRTTIETLSAHHSIAYSREVLGFLYTPEEREMLKGAAHPLVRTLRDGRRALYLAAHASHIVGWPLPEGRLLLRELTEHATQPRFVYHHAWQDSDLVIWDNRTTMHRARPFDDRQYKRELRRTTTLDIERAAAD